MKTPLRGGNRAMAPDEDRSPSPKTPIWLAAPAQIPVAIREIVPNARCRRSPEDGVLDLDS